MATLGWLKIGITTDTAQFKKGLQGASQQLSSFKGTLLGIGAGVGAAFGVKEVIGWVKGTMDATDATHDMARRLGVSTEQLARMNHVAQVAGVDQETLAGSLEKMNARLGEVAIEGSGPASDALRRYGLSARALAQESPIDAFRTVVNMLGTIPNAAERARVSMDIFGKSGQAILQMAGEGKDGIASLEAEADALGLAVSSVNAEKIGEANDALDRAWAVVQGLGNSLASELAPYITYTSDLFVSWAQGVTRGTSFISQGLDWVTAGLGYVADAVQVVQAGWHYFQAAFAEAISFVLAGVDKAIQAFGWLYEKITGVQLEVTNLARELSDAFEKAALGEMNAAETAWNKKWGHDRVRELVDDIKVQAEDRAQFAATKEANFRHNPSPVVGHKETPRLEFAGASELGSKEAYSAIVKSRAMLAGSMNSRIEQNTRATAEATQRMATGIARMGSVLEGKRGDNQQGREMIAAG